MKQIIRELKRQAAGEKLEPEQLKGLIRAGYVYRNGDEHLLTGMGREASSVDRVRYAAKQPSTTRMQLISDGAEQLCCFRRANN